MRWKKLNYDDERIIKRFLVLPRCINNEIRWLEFANIKQYWNGKQGWNDYMWIN